MAELKPCPFCGCEDIRKVVTTSHSKIWCSGCGVGMSRSYFAAYGSLAEAEKYIGKAATKAWNRRVKNADLHLPD